MQSGPAPRYRFEPVDRCNMCRNRQAHVLGKRLNQSQGLNPRGKTGVTTSIVRCHGCGLVYPNPMPMPDSIQAHYVQTPEGYWKDSYFEPAQSYFESELATLRRFGPIRKGARALDVGAGIGKGMLALAGAGFDTYGMEPIAAFRKRAVGTMGISADRISQDTVEDAEYEPESFDFITFSATLEHLYDPAAALEKALSWLCLGGTIHVEVPSSRWLVGRLLNLYYRAIGTDYVTNLSPMHVPFHIYEFDLRSFERHGELHGYDVASHDYFVGGTFLPRMADLALVPLMKATETGMQLTVWLRKP